MKTLLMLSPIFLVFLATVYFIWAFNKRTEKLAEQKAVSYTHLRAHETVLDLVCRLLLAKKKKKKTN